MAPKAPRGAKSLDSYGSAFRDKKVKGFTKLDTAVRDPGSAANRSGEPISVVENLLNQIGLGPNARKGSANEDGVREFSISEQPYAADKQGNPSFNDSGRIKVMPKGDYKATQFDIDRAAIVAELFMHPDSSVRQMARDAFARASREVQDGLAVEIAKKWPIANAEPIGGNKYGVSDFARTVMQAMVREPDPAFMRSRMEAEAEANKGGFGGTRMGGITLTERGGQFGGQGFGGDMAVSGDLPDYDAMQSEKIRTALSQEGLDNLDQARAIEMGSPVTEPDILRYPPAQRRPSPPVDADGNPVVDTELVNDTFEGSPGKAVWPPIPSVTKRGQGPGGRPTIITTLKPGEDVRIPRDVHRSIKNAEAGKPATPTSDKHIQRMLREELSPEEDYTRRLIRTLQTGNPFDWQYIFEQLKKKQVNNALAANDTGSGFAWQNWDREGSYKGFVEHALRAGDQEMLKAAGMGTSLPGDPQRDQWIMTGVDQVGQNQNLFPVVEPTPDDIVNAPAVSSQSQPVKHDLVAEAGVEPGSPEAEGIPEGMHAIEGMNGRQREAFNRAWRSSQQQAPDARTMWADQLTALQKHYTKSLTESGLRKSADELAGMSDEEAQALRAQIAQKAAAGADKRVAKAEERLEGANPPNALDFFARRLGNNFLNDANPNWKPRATRAEQASVFPKPEDPPAPDAAEAAAEWRAAVKQIRDSVPAGQEPPKWLPDPDAYKVLPTSEIKQWTRMLLDAGAPRQPPPTNITLQQLADIINGQSRPEAIGNAPAGQAQYQQVFDKQFRPSGYQVTMTASDRHPTHAGQVVRPPVRPTVEDARRDVGSFLEGIGSREPLPAPDSADVEKPSFGANPFVQQQPKPRVIHQSSGNRPFDWAGERPNGWVPDEWPQSYGRWVQRRLSDDAAEGTTGVAMPAPGSADAGGAAPAAPAANSKYASAAEILANKAGREPAEVTWASDVLKELEGKQAAMNRDLKAAPNKEAAAAIKAQLAEIGGHIATIKGGKPAAQPKPAPAPAKPSTTPDVDAKLEASATPVDQPQTKPAVVISDAETQKWMEFAKQGSAGRTTEERHKLNDYFQALRNSQSPGHQEAAQKMLDVYRAASTSPATPQAQKPSPATAPEADAPPLDPSEAPEPSAQPSDVSAPSTADGTPGTKDGELKDVNGVQHYWFKGKWRPQKNVSSADDPIKVGKGRPKALREMTARELKSLAESTLFTIHPNVKKMAQDLLESTGGRPLKKGGKQPAPKPDASKQPAPKNTAPQPEAPKPGAPAGESFDDAEVNKHLAAIENPSAPEAAVAEARQFKQRVIAAGNQAILDKINQAAAKRRGAAQPAPEGKAPEVAPEAKTPDPAPADNVEDKLNASATPIEEEASEVKQPKPKTEKPKTEAKPADQKKPDAKPEEKERTWGEFGKSAATKTGKYALGGTAIAVGAGAGLMGLNSALSSASRGKPAGYKPTPISEHEHYQEEATPSSMGGELYSAAEERLPVDVSPPTRARVQMPEAYQPGPAAYITEAPQARPAPSQRVVSEQGPSPAEEAPATMKPYSKMSAEERIRAFRRLDDRNYKSGTLSRF